MFELYLFYSESPLFLAAMSNGVHGVVIDLEKRGKPDRQQGYLTQVNDHSVDDIRVVKEISKAPVICRIEGFNPSTKTEIDEAVDCGTDEILLPMVRDPEEVAAVFDYVRGRCHVGIMVETPEAIARIESFSGFPLRRVYVGLNDLWIAEKTPHLFFPLLDNRLDRLRSCLPESSFGFAGLTAVDKGAPLPCRHLINEMARLKCDFGFLRRSFYRDVTEAGVGDDIGKLLKTIDASCLLSGKAQDQAHAATIEAVRQLPAGIWDI